MYDAVERPGHDACSHGGGAAALQSCRGDLLPKPLTASAIARLRCRYGAPVIRRYTGTRTSR
jgi:hypothetical protein